MKKKIIISALTSLIGAGLAGSITGTIAWYQYSTRAQVAYLGANGGTSENLMMRINTGALADNEGWTNRITKEQMATYLGTTAYGSKMLPITSGAMDKDGALPAKFYGNPLAGFASQSAWKEATAANYVVIPLQLCYVQRDGVKVAGVDEVYLAKEVYLTDLHIAKHAADTTHRDVSDAIRVHFSAKQDEAEESTRKNFLVSKKGGTIDTHGYLDLDGDDENDYTYANGDKYNFNDNQKQYIDYGAGQQVAFSAEQEQRAGSYYSGTTGALVDEAKVYPIVAGADAENAAKLAKKEYDTGKSKCLGSTMNQAGKYLNINITIWVEGWQYLSQADNAGNPADYSAIWDVEKFVASQFEVGFELATDID